MNTFQFLSEKNPFKYGAPMSKWLQFCPIDNEAETEIENGFGHLDGS